MNFLEVEGWRWSQSPSEHQRISFRIEVGEQVGFVGMESNSIDEFTYAIQGKKKVDAKRFISSMAAKDFLISTREIVRFNPDLSIDELMIHQLRLKFGEQSLNQMQDLYKRMQLIGINPSGRGQGIAELSDELLFLLQITVVSIFQPMVWICDLSKWEHLDLSAHGQFWDEIIRSRLFGEKTTLFFLAPSQRTYFQSFIRFAKES